MKAARGHRAGEGRRPRLAQRVGQRRRRRGARADGGLTAGDDARALRPRLRGGGGDRRRRHLLVGGRQGVRPPHVPDHDLPAGAARAPRARSASRARSAAWSAARWSPPSARRPDSTAGGGAALVALAGLLGSLAESVIGTVAERRGWLDNDLLNALNTAIGAGTRRRCSRRPRMTSPSPLPSPRAHRQACRPTSSSRVRSRCCRPALGVLSGAVTAWGAGHPKPRDHRRPAAAGRSTAR